MNTTVDYEVQLPLIHLNGNSGTALSKQYWKAVQALNELEKAFSEIEFHSRDYYPLGDEAWIKARAARQVQWLNIGSLKDYLEKHYEHCFASAR